MSTVIPIPALRHADVDGDPSVSATLPGWAYTDEAVYKRELEAIFARSWLYVGTVHDAQRPGDYFTANLLGESILVVRGQDGELRAFYNVCQHRAHQLLSGRGHVGLIVCPYHAWSYGTSGALKAAPGCEHLKDFAKENHGLKSLRLEVFADHFVFCNLDPAAASLESQTGNLADELRRDLPGFAGLRPISMANGPTYMGVVNANWKVVVDNFVECYHCSNTHPAFCDLLDMSSYTTTGHGTWSVQRTHLRAAANSAFVLPPDTKHTRASFYWLWPGMTFNVFPGDPGLVFLLQWLPAGVSTTTTLTSFLGPPGAQVDPAQLHYLNNVLGPEDLALCESVQRGLSSRGYAAGRIMFDPSGSQKSEIGVHTFHRLVAEHLGLDGVAT